MRTRHSEQHELNKRSHSRGLRSLFYTVPALAILLFTVASPLRFQSTGVQRIESTADTWKQIAQAECENEAGLAHDRRVRSYEERAAKLQNVVTATAIVYTVGGAVAGVLSGGWLAAPITVIALAEVAWMQSEIDSQLSSLTFSSSNQLRSDILKCAEEAEALEAELSVVDDMERTVVFNFQSGAILTGLVDIPNGRQTVTSAIHLGAQ